MAVEIKAYGEIKDGGFWPRDSNLYIQQLKDAGNVNHCQLTITGKNIRTLDQNSYCWALCQSMAKRFQDDGHQITPDNIYYRIQATYCTEHKLNPMTGETEEFVKPLKKQPTDRFAEIIEQVRMKFMRQYPDTHLKTPAEWYGLTEKAYDLWREGVITFAEAKKQSKQNGG